MILCIIKRNFMKNNLLLAGLLVLSSSSLFCAQQALTQEAQNLINQAHEIQITRNGDSVTLTLGEKSQTVTAGSNKSTGAFGVIIFGVGFENPFTRITDTIKVNFFTKDQDGTLFPNFEQMATEGYALILEKTV